MAVAAQEREQLVLGGSTHSCSKVEEELANWILSWKIPMSPAMLW